MKIEYDALSEDVAVGGMHSRYGIKVLLCYILKYFNTEISMRAFTEILRGGELVNYFEIGPALETLVENGLAVKTVYENMNYYKITSDGAAAVERLQSDIPLIAREKAVEIAKDIIALDRHKGSVDYKIEKLSDGCLAVMTILDKGEIMMQAKLYTADYKQAKSVCDRFVAKPEELYEKIVDTLML